MLFCATNVKYWFPLLFIRWLFFKISICANHKNQRSYPCIFCIPLLSDGIIGREIFSFQCYAWDFSPAKQRQNRNDNPFFMREIYLRWARELGSLYVRNDRALGFLPTKNVGIEMTFSFLSYRFRCSISEEISPANTSIPHCHIESPLFGVRYL